MFMTDLSNKKILIIGGSSGFGLKTAELALKANAEVIIIGRDEHRVDQSVTSLKSNANQVAGEVLDATNSEQLNRLLTHYGQFDHVISMLGGVMGGGFVTAPIAEIRQTIEDKFFANLTIAKAIWPHINNQGSMIFTSGAGGHPADASGAIVGNQAIETMVAGLAVELAPKIRVNAVAPTWTPTGLWRDLQGQELKSNQAQMVQQIPLQRVSKVEEVAKAFLFLMDNGFVTGQTIYVDGGISVN